MARFLGSTESCLRNNCVVAVNPNLSSFDALGEHQSGVQIVGDDTRGETIVGAVSALKNFFKGLELEDGLNRTEDLETKYYNI